MYQNAIASALAGKIPQETALGLVCLHEAVRRQVWCGCGRILDSRTSVLFEHEAGTLISCGTCHDKRSKGFKSRGKVTDARLHKADGTLKPQRDPAYKFTKLKEPKTFRIQCLIGTQEIQALKVIRIHGTTFYLAGKPGEYILYEYKTGLKVSKGKTQKACLELFERKMGKLSRSRWQVSYKMNCEKYGIINP